jgi:hypothetical protein
MRMLSIDRKNGIPDGSFYLRTSTNASLPVADWSRVATNSFDSTASFNLSVPVNPAQPQQYYLIQLAL